MEVLYLVFKEIKINRLKWNNNILYILIILFNYYKYFVDIVISVSGYIYAHRTPLHSAAYYKVFIFRIYKQSPEDISKFKRLT